ncbi:MAG: glycosyltransferase family 4 protein [Bacteroidetes bacterium]|nr:glycosyltransferase family 4 protein [Bacteroidota bacterium]
MPSNRILFLTLKVFSATGGIEKVCRVAGKAMYEEYLSGNCTVDVYCMYDLNKDAFGNKYFPAELFHGFAANKLKFILSAVSNGRKYNTVVISHVNLLVVGWLIKKISPRTRLIMFAHGIEVWELLTSKQKKMLGSCDRIIAVSKFTATRLQEMHQFPPEKCVVLNNCLDPFLPVNESPQLRTDLRNRYGFGKDDIVLFTLSRLSSGERYKGYDKVMQSMLTLKSRYPGIRYLLAGSYDEQEKKFLDEMIRKLQLEDSVVMTGFVPDEELVNHFKASDIYVMPSTKEGFGIVFIEAMFYGVPVIAGNVDGSVDALYNGKLGLLVDPFDVKAISNAIEKIIDNRISYMPDRKLLMEHSGYENYKRKLAKAIEANK